MLTRRFRMLRALTSRLRCLGPFGSSAANLMPLALKSWHFQPFQTHTHTHHTHRQTFTHNDLHTWIHLSRMTYWGGSWNIWWLCYCQNLSLLNSESHITTVRNSHSTHLYAVRNSVLVSFMCGSKLSVSHITTVRNSHSTRSYAVRIRVKTFRDGWRMDSGRNWCF